MKSRLILLALVASCMTIHAQEYKWTSDLLDGSMTGCTAASATNVDRALGTMVGEEYHAPSGRVYSGSSSTAKVASVVLGAQPHMADLKKVIAYSEVEMPQVRTECMLSNWFVDIVIKKVSELTGEKMDVAICNLGGIRTSMPKGDVLLDDILSMFPFKNYLVHLKMKGSKLREVFESMAANKFEAIGGATIEVTSGKIDSILIGDKPLNDEKVYNVATISFLLRGGDGYALAEHASDLQEYDIAIVDAVLEHVYALTAEGKSIKGSDARYVVIK